MTTPEKCPESPVSGSPDGDGTPGRRTPDKSLGPMFRKERGGIGYVLLWLLGVPIPVLILFALLRGCA